MKKRKINTFGISVNVILILISLTFVIPILLMISISLSAESSISKYGYQLIPQKWSFEAYRIAFANPLQIVNAYGVTAGYSAVGTVAGVILQSMMGYSLSRSNFNGKKFVTVYMMITMFIGGGLVPSYIMNTQYLRLGNNFWIYILPSLVQAWNVILFKTYFKGLPDGLVEAAKLDGASELRIYWKIIMPLSTPIIATVAFTYLLGKWNDWNTSMLYIRDSRLYSLQYLLQRIINEADYINKLRGTQAELILDAEAPSETLRYAMAVIASGPMMFVFTFFQKYFAKGLVVGSVKG